MARTARPRTRPRLLLHAAEHSQQLVLGVGVFGSLDRLAVHAVGLQLGLARAVVGIELFDANQNAVTNFTLSSASGTDYQHVGETTTAPEPSTLVLLFGSLCALAVGRQILRR